MVQLINKLSQPTLYKYQAPNACTKPDMIAI